MTRQAFLTRLALGRSAFEPLEHTPSTEDASNAQISATALPQDNEPVVDSAKYEQQYDRRGYPKNMQSKALGRQSRRAQNDVLATIGVCVAEGQSTSKALDGHKRSPQENLVVEAVRKENEIGLILSATDWGLWCLATVCTTALRHRIQTFRYYSDIPLTEIVRSEWKHFGTFQIFFAGGFASLAFYALNIAKDWGIVQLANILAKNTFMQIKPGKRKRLVSWALYLLETTLSTALFATLMPFEIYATLQRLDLMSAWPILPYPKAVFVGLPSLLQLSDLPDSMRPCVSCLKSLALSPVLSYWVLYYSKSAVKDVIYRYVRAALPKPFHPDHISLQAATEIDELDQTCIPGLIDEDNPKNVQDSISVTMELSKDLQSIGRNWQVFYDGLLGLFSRTTTESNDMNNEEQTTIQAADVSTSRATAREDSLPSARPDPSEERETPNIHTTPIDLDGEDLNIVYPTGSSTASSRSEQLELLPPSPATPEEQPPSFLPTISGSPLHPPPNSFRPPSPSPSTSPPPALSSDPSRPSSPRPQIQITTSTASTGTLHMNLLIPIPTSNPDLDGTTAPIASARYTNHPTDPQVEVEHSAEVNVITRPYHRVTALTAHASEGMAQRASSWMADLIFLPLEALFVRKVALGFLSSPAGGIEARKAAARWKGEVYAPGAWGGLGLMGGGWKGYLGRIALVQGVEWGIGLAIWQLSIGFAWQIGRRWFEWGRL